MSMKGLIVCVGLAFAGVAQAAAAPTLHRCYFSGDGNDTSQSYVLSHTFSSSDCGGSPPPAGATCMSLLHTAFAYGGVISTEVLGPGQASVLPVSVTGPAFVFYQGPDHSFKNCALGVDYICGLPSPTDKGSIFSRCNYKGKETTTSNAYIVWTPFDDSACGGNVPVKPTSWAACLSSLTLIFPYSGYDSYQVLGPGESGVVSGPVGPGASWYLGPGGGSVNFAQTGAEFLCAAPPGGDDLTIHTCHFDGNANKSSNGLVVYHQFTSDDCGGKPPTVSAGKVCTGAVSELFDYGGFYGVEVLGPGETSKLGFGVTGPALAWYLGPSHQFTNGVVTATFICGLPAPPSL